MRVDEFLTGKTPVDGEQNTAPKVMWNYTILDASGSMDGKSHQLVDGRWVQGPSKFESAVEGIKADIKSMLEDKTGISLR